MAPRRTGRFEIPTLPQLCAMLLALLCLIFGGCSMHMPISRDLAAQAEEMTVRRKKSLLTDRIHWLRFGPYRAAHIHNKQDPSEWDGRLGRARLQSEANYDFLLQKGDGGAMKCSCRNRAERVDFFPELGPVRELGYDIALDCGFVAADGGHVWKLTLTEADSSGGILRGTLGDGNRNIAVTGTRGYGDRKGKSGSHTGFRFRDEAAVELGALEMIGKPRILMRPDAQSGLRDAMAGVSMALLLYEDLNTRIRDEMQAKLVHGIQVFSALTPR